MVTQKKNMPDDDTELRDEDYDVNARLVPPPMEEYQVQVRFRFIGEESPRIWTE